uniref:alkaline phosphatase n=1 Tax=Macrostomum lignano TaxID=282301 RepID=A0A1I8H3N5_9PLAT
DTTPLDCCRHRSSAGSVAAEHLRFCNGSKVGESLSGALIRVAAMVGERGRADLLAAKAAASNLQRGRAKNLVFFLGDGLSLTSTMAGRVYKGQLQNRSGEEAQLSYETFPQIALAKTYDCDFQTSDSGATATAIGSGVKTNDGNIGVNQDVIRGNCTTYDPSKNLYSFMHYAQLAGKSVVTPTFLPERTRQNAGYCHPAGVERADWNVIFGGGRTNFLPTAESTIDYSNKNSSVSGKRQDGVNLINRWRNLQSSKMRRFAFAESKSQFDAIDPANTDYVLGLFATSHLRYQLDNEMDPTYQEPSLSEMVDKAIRILSRNPNGFALFVEAGRIDHAHHDNYGKRALHDVLELDRAVTRAMGLTNRADTLMLVTGDHSHVFTVGGWGLRGNPILGRVVNSDEDRYNSKGEAVAYDGMPYTVLNYADGPSAAIGTPRKNLTDANTTAVNFQFPALYNYDYESHGAEDVPVYAAGPSAYLLHSTHEQSYIGHVVMYALCVGPEASVYCADEEAPTTTGPYMTGQPLPRSASGLTASSVLLALAYGFRIWVES